MKKPDPVVSIAETFITNIPRGRKEPPKGEPWIGYLFAKFKSGKKDVVELRGGTELERDRAICDWIESNHVAVVPE